MAKPDILLLETELAGANLDVAHQISTRQRERGREKERERVPDSSLLLKNKGLGTNACRATCS